jgi:membrane protease YdiL (CAAX protease family)
MTTPAEAPGRKGAPSFPGPELLELAAILAVVAAARFAALPFAPPSVVAAALFLYVPVLRLRGERLPDWLATAGPSPARTAAWTAALLLVGVAAFLLWVRLPLPPGLRPPRGGVTRWSAFLPAMAVTALSEEVYFRGRLQDALAARRLPAVSGGALLFAAAHLLLLPTPYRGLTFFPALLFGWLRRRTGTIYAPAALHFAFNLLPPLAGGAP